MSSPSIAPTSATTRCAACQTALEPAARFCSVCGTPVPSSHEGPAEWRFVTIVTYQLPGLTEILELHPELLSHPVLGLIRRRLRELFGSAGAVLVEGKDRDEMNAVFGARVASADTAEQALRAAVQAREVMREACAEALRATGASLHIKMGIDSDKALIQVGDGDDGLVVRGVPLLAAARLAEAARHDAILVDETTRRAVGDRFTLVPIEPIVFGSRTARLPAYSLEMHGARPRPASRLMTSRMLRPLVGRDQEIATLRRHLEQAIETRSLHRATLLGPPGSGRSRLVQELIQQLRGSWGQLRVVEVEVPARDGVAAAFGIVGRIVASQARLDAAASLQDARARLRELIASIHGTGQRPLDAMEEQWLFHLTGLGDAPVVAGGDPELAGEISYRSVIELLRTAAQGAPLLLVLEDAGAAIPPHLAAVARLAADLAELPVMLLLTASDALDERGEWLPLADRDLTVALGPLSHEAGRVLVDQVLGLRDALPREVADAIVDHANGMPLFIEETLGALTDAGLLAADPTTGAWSLHAGSLPSGLPATLEGLVAARLDQMPEGLVAVLRKASVVGDIFWRGLIEDLGEPQAAFNLEQLEAQGLIRRSFGSTLLGHIGYRFNHVVTRDVAYSDVPDAEARALHARTARWLAVNSGERFNEWLGAIAWHFATADEPARAVSYHMQAGSWARQRGDVGEAAFQFERARYIAPSQEMAMEAAIELADAYYHGGRLDDAARELGEVAPWAERRGDLRLRLRCHVLAARVATERGVYERAEREVEEGLVLARRIGGIKERQALLLDSSRIALQRGDEALALSLGQDSERIAIESDDALGALKARMQIARPLLNVGRLEQTRALLHSVEERARSAHHWVYVHRARQGRAWLDWLQGQPAQAATVFGETSGIFARLGVQRLEAMALLGQALSVLALGRHAEAANAAAAGLAAAERAGSRAVRGLAHACLGHIYGSVEQGRHRIQANQLTPLAIQAARTDRLSHLALGRELVEAAPPAPRLFRLLAAVAQAEYLLGRDPADETGLRARADAVTLATGFDPCVLTARIERLGHRAA